MRSTILALAILASPALALAQEVPPPPTSAQFQQALSMRLTAELNTSLSLQASLLAAQTALSAAQARVAELEKQLAAAKQACAPPPDQK